MQLPQMTGPHSLRAFTLCLHSLLMVTYLLQVCLCVYVFMCVCVFVCVCACVGEETRQMWLLCVSLYCVLTIVAVCSSGGITCRLWSTYKGEILASVPLAFATPPPPCLSRHTTRGASPTGNNIDIVVNSMSFVKRLGLSDSFPALVIGHSRGVLTVCWMVSLRQLCIYFNQELQTFDPSHWSSRCCLNGANSITICEQWSITSVCVYSILPSVLVVSFLRWRP